MLGLDHNVCTEPHLSEGKGVKLCVGDLKVPSESSKEKESEMRKNMRLQRQLNRIRETQQQRQPQEANNIATAAVVLINSGSTPPHIANGFGLLCNAMMPQTRLLTG